MAIDLSKSYEYFQPEKVDCRIHIVGCGSVGATVAELLVRLGLTNIALWDIGHGKPAQSGESDFPSAGHWAL